MNNVMAALALLFVIVVLISIVNDMRLARGIDENPPRTSTLDKDDRGVI